VSGENDRRGDGVQAADDLGAVHVRQVEIDQRDGD
jgi:hypothetical protein